MAFILTSLGIFSVTLTFGVQSFVKDFVAGFCILFENSVMVGDQVDLDGRVGVVEWLSLRTIRIRADNGMLQTIPFGSITVIGNKSSGFVHTLINLSVAYDESPEKVAQLLEKTYQMLKNHPIYGRKILSTLEQRGIVEVTDYSTVFQARLKVAPGEQERMRRMFTMTLKKVCDEAGVKVPSPPYALQRSPKAPSLTMTEL
jgi:small-conductance mechanosensitive channel